MSNVSEAVETRQDLSLAHLEALLPADSPLLKYVQWACRRYGAPPLYHLAAVLTFMAYELTRRGFVIIERDEEIPLTLWFALVGASSTGKSTAINTIQRISRVLWEELEISLLADPWVEPEGSIQGVFVALQERYDAALNTTPALVFHHELAQVFATREPVSEQFCKLADGASIQANYRQHQKRKRQDAHADELVNPRLSLITATTEDQLAPHFKNAQRSGGIFARFIWLAPTFEEAHRRLLDDTDAATAARARQDVVHALRGWAVLLGDDSAANSFELSPEARHAVNELSQQWWLRVGPQLQSLCARTVQKVQVIGAIFASMRGSFNVERCDIEPAITLVKVFVEQARGLTSLGAEDDVSRHAKRVAKVVQGAGSGGVNRREMYTHLRTSKRTLDLVIETLEDSGEVFRLQTDSARAGRFIHRDHVTSDLALVHEGDRVVAKPRHGFN